MLLGGLATPGMQGLGGRAEARPFVAEDLLRREDVGAIVFTPDDRWLILERRGPIVAGSRFDFGRLNLLFRTTILRVDVEGGGPAAPLFPHEAGVGYKLGPVSPDGRRAAVFRLGPRVWELGIASVAEGSVRWTAVTPEAPSAARNLQWRTPDELLVVALEPGALPYGLRALRPQAGLPERWAATARGEASLSVVGSGALAGAGPAAPGRALLSIDARTGASRTLAEGDFTDLEVSPDGRRVALLAAAERIPLKAEQEPQGDYGIAERRQRLQILDLLTGRCLDPAPDQDMLAGLLNWSPASDRLLVYGRPGGPWSGGALLVVEAATGSLRPAAPQAVRPTIAGRPERIGTGWLGDTPLVRGRLANGPEQWLRLGTRPAPLLPDAATSAEIKRAPSTPGQLLIASGSDVWRLDRRGRARRLALSVTPLAARFDDLPPRTLGALPNRPELAGVALSPTGRQAVRLGPTGEATLVLQLGPAETPLAIGRQAAVIRATGPGGAETLLLRRPDTADRELARLNSHLAEIDPSTTHAVVHTGPDGKPLTSWLFLPASTGRIPPPLVVIPYPGAVHRQAPRIDAGTMEATRVLLGHGYAVLRPSLPLTDGGPAEGLADRVLGIVATAAAQPDLAGRFDPERIGLWGHSFGAYAVAAMITQTDRFRAAVASAPTANLTSTYGQFSLQRRLWPENGPTTPWSAGWTERLQGDMRAPPWRDPSRYLRNSPLMAADRIRTPILMVYGEIDGSHPGQAEELFSALYRQDRDAIMVTYWGEPHLFESPGNVRDFYRRGLALLDTYLTPSPSKPPQQGSPGTPKPPHGHGRETPAASGT